MKPSFLLWIGISLYSAKFGTFDLRLLTKRYDQRLPVLIPLTTLILVSLSLFVVGQNLADASGIHVHIDRSRHDKGKDVILTARDIVVEFDVRDKVLTAIRGFSLD